MGGLKLLHSTAETGKRQMQTDGGINRWHTWRAHKPFLNSISSTSWTFGESSGFLVIRYRSAGARLWKTHKVTHSLSPFHTLHSLRGITRTSWDLIKKKKEEKKLYEETVVWGQLRTEREEQREWCVKKKRPENDIRTLVKTKKGGKKINVPFFSSIWFHFPHVALHHRGRRGKAEHSEKEWERAREWNYSHPKEQWIPDTSKTHNQTPLMLRLHRSEQQFCPSERICRLYRVSAILSLFSNLPVFHFWFSEWRFPFCFIFKWRMFP